MSDAALLIRAAIAEIRRGRIIETDDLAEAADEIERLIAELAAVRATLAQYEQTPVMWTPANALKRLRADGSHIGTETVLYRVERDGFCPLIARPEVTK